MLAGSRPAKRLAALCERRRSPAGSSIRASSQSTGCSPADGQPFYAMRFIRGETLEAAIDRYHASSAAVSSDRMLQLRSLLQA